MCDRQWTDFRLDESQISSALSTGKSNFGQSGVNTESTALSLQEVLGDINILHKINLSQLLIIEDTVIHQRIFD